MSDSKKENEVKTGDGQPGLIKSSKPKWTDKDETLLAELLARRSEFREKQDAAIAEFLDRIALAEIYKHWRIFEKNADEVIALLEPFSHLSSSS